jgi:glucan phosphoethanolaminetransferase (alkaline phosphatase superfamily)
MRFKYETGIITFVQFVALSLLGIGNLLNSVVSTCHDSSTDCISNLLVSLIFFLLTTAWFAVVWVLGWAAQERRSRKLALLLIGAEAFIALIAFFNAKHHTDYLSLFTSLVDFFLALWVITLAWRLMRAKGGRVVTKQRARQRRRPTQN